MKKVVYFFLIVTFIGIVACSCKTTPAPETQEPVIEEPAAPAPVADTAAAPVM
jgi:hypothetical protein